MKTKHGRCLICNLPLKALFNSLYCPICDTKETQKFEEYPSFGDMGITTLIDLPPRGSQGSNDDQDP